MPPSHAVTLTIATINVNGLRAAARNGLHRWIDQRRPDVISIQEVRAPDEIVAELLGPGWFVTHAQADAKGRAGVAVASRIPIESERSGHDQPAFARTGRWVEADLRVDDGTALTVVSCYAHTGDADDELRMAEKLAFFDAITDRIEALRSDGRHVLLTGDLNVAHRDTDVKNWKGNRGCAGCLPAERAYFDRWIDERGWVDVVRRLSGDVAGPYSWWSYRGRAYDNDAGWRIDYQIATPSLGACATSSSVDRAATYAERWSDHAPVVVTYDV